MVFFFLLFLNLRGDKPNKFRATEKVLQMLAWFWSGNLTSIIISVNLDEIILWCKSTYYEIIFNL